MLAYKCDICGVYFEDKTKEEDLPVITHRNLGGIIPGRADATDDTDVCSKCLKEVIKFVEYLKQGRTMRDVVLVCPSDQAEERQ